MRSRSEIWKNNQNQKGNKWRQRGCEKGETQSIHYDFQLNSVRTMHDSQHHVSFRKAVGNVAVAGVRAPVNDAVHVQVEMIELRQQSIVRDNLIDLGVALRDPSVELPAS